MIEKIPFGFEASFPDQELIHILPVITIQLEPVKITKYTVILTNFAKANKSSPNCPFLFNYRGMT
jgi:hypothetical protein